MTYNVFAVYDLKTCAYLQPFFSPNSGSAIRAFGDACQEEKCPFRTHPEDYQLFEIGSWDDNAGSILNISPNKYLCSANDFVQGRSVSSAIGVFPQDVGLPDLAATNGGK